MASLNKVMLIGNLTREPEVRYTPKGSAVCDLGIAVNRTYVTDSGEKMQETTYVDVVVWSRLAEIAAQYLHKGSPVFIEGRLQMDTWEDKATMQKRTKLRVVADNLQFLGRREGGDEGGGGFHPEAGQQQAPQQQAPRPAMRPNVRPAGGGGGGNYGGGGAGGGGNYPQRQPGPPPQRQHNDDFGDGPITEGLDDDEIPF
jgi:single-strand DNA-binding protein